MSKLVLNKELFIKALSENYKGEKICMSAVSSEMGIDRSHLFRVLKDKQNPGRKFIEGVLKVCKGYSLNELFSYSSGETKH